MSTPKKRAYWKMSEEEDRTLEALLGPLDAERQCEVGIHLPDSGGHSYGPVRHFLIYTCPQCGTVGTSSACRAVAERIARNPVWMLQCEECMYTGSRYIFKTEVRGI